MCVRGETEYGKPVSRPGADEYLFYLKNKKTHDFNPLLNVAVPKK